MRARAHDIVISYPFKLESWEFKMLHQRNKTILVVIIDETGQHIVYVKGNKL